MYLSYLPGQQVVSGSCSSFMTWARSVLVVLGNSAVLIALRTVTSVLGGPRSNVSTGLTSDSSIYSNKILFSNEHHRLSQPCFSVL